MAYIPFFVCLVGLLIYLLARPTAPKAQDIGHVMFYLGLAAFLLQCVLGRVFPEFHLTH